MAKKIDPLKAKEKKQKIIAGVGAVLLLGLMAVQVPKVLKHMNQKPPARPVAATTTAGATPSATPSLAAPTLRGEEQAASTPATADGGSLTSSVVPAQDGQLASFSRFSSKDPFSPQISENDTTSPAPAGGGSSPSPSTSTSSGSGSQPSGSSSGGGSVPAPGSAVISLNGALMSVTVGGDFPAATAGSPALFHLLSLTASTARITIVGGSYSNGAPAVTLTVNKPVTLMNTADGTRYKLILKPQGTAVPGATSAPAGATPTVTLPPATP